jgi:hypothetical protein
MQILFSASSKIRVDLHLPPKNLLAPLHLPHGVYQLAVVGDAFDDHRVGLGAGGGRVHHHVLALPSLLHGVKAEEQAVELGVVEKKNCTFAAQYKKSFNI